MKKSRSNGLHTLLCVLWGAVALFGCSPCHTGHTEVTFEAAHSSYEYDFFEEDWVWNHYPDRCSASFSCDLRCEVLDTGKAEAHAKHGTLNLYGDKVDPRCIWERGEARVR